jgi:hypothetical protein
MGFFFDGFARNLEQDRQENRVSKIARLSMAHHEPDHDDDFTLYRKAYLPGLGQPGRSGQRCGTHHAGRDSRHPSRRAAQIILPQPQPRKWQAFSPARALDVNADDIPYWLIAQRAFPK